MLFINLAWPLYFEISAPLLDLPPLYSNPGSVEKVSDANVLVPETTSVNKGSGNMT